MIRSRNPLQRRGYRTVCGGCTAATGGLAAVLCDGSELLTMQEAKPRWATAPGDVLSTRASSRRTSRRQGRRLHCRRSRSTGRPARWWSYSESVRSAVKRTTSYSAVNPARRTPPTRARPPVYYTHRRSAPAFRSFSVRSAITGAVKQRLGLKAAE